MKPIFEQIPIQEHRTIHAFRYAKKNFETPWHFHPQHELTFIEESFGTKYVGDFIGAYEPGELVLLRSNLPHCWRNQQKPNQMAVSVVIQWNKDIYASVPELQLVFALLNSASRGIIFDIARDHDCINRMRRLPDLEGQNLYVELLGLLINLTEYEYRTLSSASFPEMTSGERNRRIGMIYEFVEANYVRKIYLKEVAGLLNLSEQSFSRFFSRMMGRPFFVFLNQYRINVASRLLIDTDQSVEEIGYSSGYDALPFFYKQFKKFKGTSPMQFRRKYQIKP